MGKMLILTFDDGEEELFNNIISIARAGAEVCQMKQIGLSDSSGQDLVIDVGKRMILKKGKEVELTFKEFEIFYLLAKNPGKVFSKEEIYDEVWDEPYYGDYNIVMSHIRHIREKVEDDPAKPFYIQTVWGVGYRFNKNM